MRILLFGDYSNVHWTLAQGLRELGHEVCVISNGDGWKNYPRDIDLTRKSLKKKDTIKYITKVLTLLPKMRGYDIVQIINPIFIDVKASHVLPIFKFLKSHNKSVFLGAFGMDYYWVKTCLDCKTFRYSDFNIGTRQRTTEQYNKDFIHTWLETKNAYLNQYIAKKCNGIIAGLYEYFKCYEPEYKDKTTFIPFPIDVKTVTSIKNDGHKTVRFFVGVQKTRSEYKGTDIMLKALERLQNKYPELCEIIKVESVPFERYKVLMDSSDVLLDQLYSYTPAMNALLAMAKGLVVVGGGEPENYEILGESDLKPIINVLPDEDDVFNKLEKLLLNKSDLPRLSKESAEYVRKHHDHIKVAQQYVTFWKSRMNSDNNLRQD